MCIAGVVLDEGRNRECAMGIVLEFQGHQATDSTVVASGGYKSGRRSERGTPEARSTAITLNGGTSSHCETAALVMPMRDAKRVRPPAASIARLKASLRSVMDTMSSTTLLQSQGPLHCWRKAVLYNQGMLPPQIIKKARLAKNLTLQELGDKRWWVRSNKAKG